MWNTIPPSASKKLNTKVSLHLTWLSLGNLFQPAENLAIPLEYTIPISQTLSSLRKVTCSPATHLLPGGLTYSGIYCADQNNVKLLKSYSNMSIIIHWFLFYYIHCRINSYCSMRGVIHITLGHDCWKSYDWIIHYNIKYFSPIIIVEISFVHFCIRYMFCILIFQQRCIIYVIIRCFCICF